MHIGDHNVDITGCTPLMVAETTYSRLRAPYWFPKLKTTADEVTNRLRWEDEHHRWAIYSGLVRPSELGIEAPIDVTAYVVADTSFHPTGLLLHDRPVVDSMYDRAR